MGEQPQSFKDHFSGHASSYAEFRPDYPEELFNYIASLCKKREAVWDCATGNGQAALPLSDLFQNVYATDASEAQIASAKKRPNIHYSVAPAEASGLPDASADLVTVAQALHWFDLSRFYPEVKRVLRPDGVIAAWCYNLVHITSEIDEVMLWFYDGIVGPDWPAERALVNAEYRPLDFPFEEVSAPRFFMRRTWNMVQLLDYVRTWSAVQRHLKRTGIEPVGTHLEPRLLTAWGDPSTTRAMRFPVGMRVGRR
jgi:SAM-dependent methyltransferase